MGHLDRAKLSAMASTVTAAVLVIGNEILSGRTQDANLGFLARRLTEIGVELREARVVADAEAEIVAAVRELSRRYDYLFTTGGIGPTHDDITADAVAKAFGLEVRHHPEAVALLEESYRQSGMELNEARLRMARVPVGAKLVYNPVSAAPGFQLENVFVLAGVPSIMRAMFEGLVPRLKVGPRTRSRTLTVRLGEGTVAAGLRELQQRHADVQMGSYPFYRDGVYGTDLVLRATDPARLEAALEDLRRLVAGLGGEAVEAAAE
jgi:molybdenum cofactor synthesis domain-containing protein